jgi:16S rRNA (guanine527-N7)-methyltransferase
MMQIDSEEWRRMLQEGAETMGLVVAPAKVDQFAIYATELMLWNRRINLTAIKNPRDVAVMHFLDSIAPAKLISPNASLLDIGSGGGFPGVPLKILFPNLSVCLIDSSRKKVTFLKHIIRKLQLKNIEAVEGRAEALSREESFHIILSRAVSRLDTLILIGSPLLAKDGMMIAFKGFDVGSEIDAARSVGSHFSFQIKPYTLPYLGVKRSLVIIRRRMDSNRGNR